MDLSKIPTDLKLRYFDVKTLADIASANLQQIVAEVNQAFARIEAEERAAQPALKLVNTDPPVNPPTSENPANG